MSIRRALTRWWLWGFAAFCGFLVTVSATTFVPALAAWESPIVCRSGTALHHTTVVTHFGYGQTSDANGTPTAAHDGSGVAFRCVGHGSVSEDITGVVLTLQLVGSTVVLYVAFSAIGWHLARKRRSQEHGAGPPNRPAGP